MTDIKSIELPSAKAIEKTGSKESTERRRPVTRGTDSEDRKNKFKKALNLNALDAVCDEERENEPAVSGPSTMRSLFDLARQTSENAAPRENTAVTSSAYAAVEQTVANQPQPQPERVTPQPVRMPRAQSTIEHVDFVLPHNEIELMEDDLTQDSSSQEGDNSRHVVSPYIVKELSKVDTHVAPAEQPGKANEVKKVHMLLVRELIDSMKILSTSDRTETTVTLQQPPVFSGVSLVVTEFKSAQKEFNLTFLNLTNPEARALIELGHNQDSLRAQLLEKGYHLHMVTIEPKIDIKLAKMGDAQIFAQSQDKGKDQEPDLKERKKK